jgi:hypothetical protein
MDAPVTQKSQKPEVWTHDELEDTLDDLVSQGYLEFFIDHNRGPEIRYEIAESARKAGAV